MSVPTQLWGAQLLIHNFLMIYCTNGNGEQEKWRRRNKNRKEKVEGSSTSRTVPRNRDAFLVRAVRRRYIRTSSEDASLMPSFGKLATPTVSLCHSRTSVNNSCKKYYLKRHTVNSNSVNTAENLTAVHLTSKQSSQGHRISENLKATSKFYVPGAWREKVRNEDPQILSAAAQNPVAWVTWHPGFLHPCQRYCSHISEPWSWSQ